MDVKASVRAHACGRLPPAPCCQDVAGQIKRGNHTIGQDEISHSCRSWSLPCGAVQRPPQPGRAQAWPQRWLPEPQSHLPSCIGTSWQVPRQFSAPLSAQARPHACSRSAHMWRPVCPALSLQALASRWCPSSPSQYSQEAWQRWLVLQSCLVCVPSLQQGRWQSSQVAEQSCHADSSC
jgi:hypothetical protein